MQAAVHGHPTQTAAIRNYSLFPHLQPTLLHAVIIKQIVFTFSHEREVVSGCLMANILPAPEGYEQLEKIDSYANSPLLLFGSIQTLQEDISLSNIIVCENLMTQMHLYLGDRKIFVNFFNEIKQNPLYKRLNTDINILQNFLCHMRPKNISRVYNREIFTHTSFDVA